MTLVASMQLRHLRFAAKTYWIRKILRYLLPSEERVMIEIVAEISSRIAVGFARVIPRFVNMSEMLISKNSFLLSPVHCHCFCIKR